MEPSFVLSTHEARGRETPFGVPISKVLPQRRAQRRRIPRVAVRASKRCSAVGAATSVTVGP